jgi:hypothetical protein
MLMRGSVAPARAVMIAASALMYLWATYVMVEVFDARVHLWRRLAMLPLAPAELLLAAAGQGGGSGGVGAEGGGDAADGGGVSAWAGTIGVNCVCVYVMQPRLRCQCCGVPVARCLR